MHYLWLEFEAAVTLTPPIAELQGFGTPSPDACFLYNRAALYRADAKGATSPVELPGPFEPQLLVEAPRHEMLLIDALGDCLVLGQDGGLRRRLSLGTGIADAATDEFGILVLRNSGSLDKFSFDGAPMVDDEQVRRVNAVCQAREGSLLLVPYDGSIWINLEDHFDDAGEPRTRLDPVRLFGEGRVAADLLAHDDLIVLTESGRILAVDDEGRTYPARFDAAAVEKALGRRLSASTDCLSTRGTALSVLATDKNALLRFQVYAE